MPLLVLLLIVVPIIEIWAILQVGHVIGPWWTIALLVADSLLGAWLLRHQGRQAWWRFRDALSAGRIPANETADGALVVVGGTLLLTPGFVTDIVGFLLLIGPTRRIVRRFAMKRGLTMGAAAFGPAGVWTVRGAQWGGAGAKAYRATRTPRSYDVDGTASDADASPPALGGPGSGIQRP